LFTSSTLELKYPLSKYDSFSYNKQFESAETTSVSSKVNIGVGDGTSDYYYDDVEDSCEYCRQKLDRVTFKEFCKNDQVFLIQIASEKQDDKGEDLDFENIESKIQIANGNFIRFTSKLDTLYKNGLNSAQVKKQQRRSQQKIGYSKPRYYQLINKAADNENTNFNAQEDDKISMWLASKDFYCSCPKIKPRRKYLVMTKNSNILKYFLSSTPKEASPSSTIDDLNNSIQLNYDLNEDPMNKNSTFVLDTSSTKTKKASTGVLIDRETFIVEWKSHFARRLRRFLKYFQNGRCP
jgi:hypothetical protein